MKARYLNGVKALTCLLDGKSFGVTDRKLLYVPAARHEVKLVFQGRELVADFDLQKDETHFLTADFKQVVAEAGGKVGPIARCSGCHTVAKEKK